MLTKLGRGDLIHRGNTYRVVRGAKASALPDRNGYEVVSGREAHLLLEEMVTDPTRPELQKPVLTELALQFTKPRVSLALEIVLLRGMRIYARPANEEPASTPSQLFKEKHFIAVESVDAEEKPVAGIALEFVLPDGNTKSARTNDEGYARVDLAQAGSVIIRVPGIDGSSWRAVGGAAASPSGTEPPVRNHVVKQGECLSKIAMKYGFPKWETVWQHGANAELRKKRKSPNVLFPGDKLAVPGMAVNQITRDADATHRIEVKRPASTVDVSVTFRDSKGKALSGQAFELRWGGEKEPKVSGTLDGSGTLKETVPITVADVELLLVERGERYVLATSHLDPVQDEGGAFLISGVATRLSALGYLHRMPKEITALTIRDAILAFQRDEMGQSEPSGELDAATCQKLEELYGV